jgi:hypothetical protein
MNKVELPEAIKLSDHLKKPLQGYYIGIRKVESKKTESGESLLHVFKEKDGTEVEIWSFDKLKRLLSKIPYGCMVKMIYTGQIKEGEKAIHQVDVYYDPDDKIQIESENN